MAKSNPLSSAMVPPLVQAFLEALVAERGVSIATWSAYQTDLKHFFSSMGQDPLAITPPIIKQYLALLHDQNFKPRSIARKLSALRQFYGFIASENPSFNNPTQRLRSPKLGRTLPKVLSEDEVQRILKAIDALSITDKQRLWVMMEILYATGARVSELVGLKIGDFAEDFHVVTFRGKGSKERMVPLSPGAAQIVREYIGARSGTMNVNRATWVFPSRGASGHITRQRVGQLLKHLAQAATIDPQRLSPHVMRHAFATHLLDNGADLLAIQELLGHSDAGTTQIYTHVLSQKLQALLHTKHPLGAQSAERARLDGRKQSIDTH